MINIIQLRTWLLDQYNTLACLLDQYNTLACLLDQYNTLACLLDQYNTLPWIHNTLACLDNQYEYNTLAWFNEINIIHTCMVIG